MNREQVLDIIGHIDPHLVEEADCSIKPRQSKLNKTILIAACICLLLLTTTLATSMYYKKKAAAPEIEYYTNIVLEPSGEIRDGYRPILKPTTDQPENIEINTKVSVDSFSEAFLRDVANRPESETIFRCYFDSWSDMEAYLGFNMWDNPLLDAAEPSYIISNGTKTHGYLYSTEMDHIITSVSATAVYHINPTEVSSGYSGSSNTVSVSINVTATVYTEYSPIKEEEMFSGRYFASGTEFTDEIYMSSSGQKFSIVKVLEHTDYTDLIRYFGFVRIGNTYITVESTFFPSAETALSVLKQVLDGFVIE